MGTEKKKRSRFKTVAQPQQHYLDQGRCPRCLSWFMYDGEAFYEPNNAGSAYRCAGTMRSCGQVVAWVVHDDYYVASSVLVLKAPADVVVSRSTGIDPVLADDVLRRWRDPKPDGEQGAVDDALVYWRTRNPGGPAGDYFASQIIETPWGFELHVQEDAESPALAVYPVKRNGDGLFEFCEADADAADDYRPGAPS
jgi:hypothetical protein